MKSYFCIWEVSVKANSPEEAALKARKLQLNNKIPTAFKVFGPKLLRKKIKVR